MKDHYFKPIQHKIKISQQSETFGHYSHTQLNGIRDSNLECSTGCAKKKEKHFKHIKSQVVNTFF